MRRKHKIKRPKSNRHFSQIAGQIQQIAGSLGLEAAITDSRLSTSLYITVHHPIFDRTQESYVIRISDHGQRRAMTVNGHKVTVELDIGEHQQAHPFDSQMVEAEIQRKFNMD